MIRTQLHYLILISLMWCTALYPMHHSTADTLSTMPSVHNQISTEIFQCLPQELVPLILAHTNLPKNRFLYLCKATYNYFCFRNHLAEKPVAQKPDNWEFLLARHPYFIVTNEYDCQRLYYLLIKSNNLIGMKQLLEDDEDRETNLRQIVDVCFGSAALESRILPGMKTLIYEYSQGRNMVGELCFKSVDCSNSCYNCQKRGYEGCFNEKTCEFIDIIMTNNVDSINKKLPDFINLPKFQGRYISQCLCYYGSQPMQESFYTFIRDNDPTDAHEILGDALYYAIFLNDYTKAEQLLSYGANPDDYGQMREDGSALMVAIKRAYENDNYTLLTLLKKYHVEVNLDFITTYPGYVYRAKDLNDKTISALFAYFGQTPLQDLIEGIVSPLLHAVLLQNPKLVRALLDCGANPCGPQSCGNPLSKRIPSTDLLEIAKALGNVEIIDAIAAAQIAITQGKVDELLENMYFIK